MQITPLGGHMNIKPRLLSPWQTHEKFVRETRTENLHKIEHALFDARNISLQVGMTHVQVSRAS